MKVKFATDNKITLHFQLNFVDFYMHLKKVSMAILIGKNTKNLLSPIICGFDCYMDVSEGKA